MIKLALERITLGGRVWLDGYIRLEEQPVEVSGANVAADNVHLYAKDNGGGISRLFYKDDGQVEHEVVTSGSGGGGVTDHGALTGLADDDHAQYLLTADATSRALFAANWLDLTDLGATTLHSHSLDSANFTGTNWTDLTDGGATTLHSHAAPTVDHGALTGLSDDDHTQYALLAGRSGGQVLIGGTGVDDDLTLKPTSGVGSTSSNLFLAVGNNGSIPGLRINSLGKVGIGSNANHGSQLYIPNQTTDQHAIQVEGAVGQTASLQVWQDSGGNTVTEIDLVGILATYPALGGGIGIGTNVLSTAAFHSVATQTRQFLFNRTEIGVGSGDGTYFQCNDVGQFAIVNQETTSDGLLRFATGGDFHFYMDYVGNFLINDSQTSPGTGTKGLIFGDGTALSSMASNTAGLYANDVGGTVTMFNIAEDGRIKDLLWPRVARCGTQFDATTTTLGDVTGLTHTLAAAKTYEFEAILHVTASLVGGSKFAMTGDGTLSATSITYHVDLLDNTTNAHTITSRQTALAGAAGQAGTTEGMCRISGTIVVNAAGALRVQFAQNAANGTSSVLVNSSFTVRKID